MTVPSRNYLSSAKFQCDQLVALLDRFRLHIVLELSDRANLLGLKGHFLLQFEQMDRGRYTIEFCGRGQSPTNAPLQLRNIVGGETFNRPLLLAGVFR